MKFGRVLKEQAIVEWRRAYINYRILKKLIQKARAELERIDAGLSVSDAEEEVTRELYETRTEAHAQTHESLENVSEEGHHVPSAAQNNEILERQISHFSKSDDHDSDKASEDGQRTVRSIQTSTSAEPLQTGGYSTFERQDSAHRVSKRPSGFFRAPEEGERARLTPPPVQEEEGVRGTPGGVRRMGTFLESLGTSGHLSVNNWRPGFSKDMSLAELEAKCPPACQRFFIAVLHEIEKVDQFYIEREMEAVDQLLALRRQWEILIDHKKQYKASQGWDVEAPRILKPIINVGATTNALVRRHIQPDPLKTESSLHFDEETNAFERIIKLGKPEEYKSARAKLKVASFEYYRSLGMIKSYRLLNETGFTKALKKFEKATRIPCSKAFNKEKIKKAHFMNSDKLDDLIRQTEDAFADVFEHGDRKKALSRLRDFGSHRMHHFTAWRAGVLFGASVPLLLQGIVISTKSTTRAEIPYWMALLQLFGALFLPVVFGLLFYLNMLAWSYGRINYTLIFDLDIRTQLDIHQFIELPSVFLFLFSIMFWLAFNNFWPDHIAPSAYPLAFLVASLTLLLLPLPVLYHDARWWLVRSLFRVVTGGLYPVEFRDFFLGDELVSLYYTIYNMGYLICTYNHHWPSNAAYVCSANSTWASPALGVLPSVFRLGQSVRRYVDSDGLAIHALNAGKYSAGIVQLFFYFNWRIRGSQSDWSKALWILFSVINSVYTSTWDIVMDWSLGRLDQSKHFFLRSELGYKETVYVYYIAIVVNVILRFSWLVYVNGSKPPPFLMGYIIALLEMVRRVQWNTFRVESEHIGNVDGYRVTRNVPLPYVTTGGTSTRGGDSPNLSRQSSRSLQEEDDSDGKTRKERLVEIFSSLNQNVKSAIGAVKLTTYSSHGASQEQTESGRTAADLERGPPTPFRMGRKKNDIDSSDEEDEEDEDEEDMDELFSGKKNKKTGNEIAQSGVAGGSGSRDP